MKRQDCCQDRYLNVCLVLDENYSDEMCTGWLQIMFNPCAHFYFSLFLFHLFRIFCNVNFGMRKEKRENWQKIGRNQRMGKPDYGFVFQMVDDLPKHSSVRIVLPNHTMIRFGEHPEGP